MTHLVQTSILQKVNFYNKKQKFLEARLGGRIFKIKATQLEGKLTALCASRWNTCFWSVCSFGSLFNKFEHFLFEMIHPTLVSCVETIWNI